MKTLMMSTALAVALGFSTNVFAESINAGLSIQSNSVQISPALEEGISQRNDFYQGDYLVETRAPLTSLTKEDLYTGKGASESSTNRWVTDF